MPKGWIPEGVEIAALVSCPFPPKDVFLQMLGQVSAEGFRAAAMLMFGAWQQKPCGTLPKSDEELSQIANYGWSTEGWLQVKEEALRGWVVCADGRMHHPGLARIVLEMWLDRVQASIKGAKGNATRWSLDVDEAQARAQLVDAATALKALDPKARALKSPLIARLLNMEEEVPWRLRHEVRELMKGGPDIELLFLACRDIMGAKDNDELAVLLKEPIGNLRVWNSRKKLPGWVLEEVSRAGGVTVEALLQRAIPQTSAP